jgi:Zn-dependent metalloprotease
VFGDGDIFDRFTKSLDVIGHELTHGVTEKEAGLHYLNQSGALNESVSDVFGVLVKQYKLGQTADEADWLIGADIVTPRFPGTALRSMAEPGTAWEHDDQPAKMKNYVHTHRDNGGVHTNSGIPNKAFHDLSIALGGYAWEKAGRIWYETLRDRRLKADAHFIGFARTTLATTRRLYGANSDELDAVQDAWKGVGITVN